MSQAQEYQPRLTAVCSKLFWETGPGYIAREKTETFACVIFCQCVCTSVMADYLQQKTHQEKYLSHNAYFAELQKFAKRRDFTIQLLYCRGEGEGTFVSRSY